MPYDPHKNIFYYYRGPSKRNDEDIIYDIQVEDNTTKAFINCLENSSSSLLNHFLKYFDLDFKYKSKPQYLLQVSRAKSRPDAQIKSSVHSIYIESKVAASVNKEQLKKHKNQLGINDLLVLITKDDVADMAGIKEILAMNFSKK
ncbi:MAG: hypothetical protein JW770_06660 [Actinobacteria bacterium]|nr:hypothetical protein [Actinomycetota bacterium]